MHVYKHVCTCIYVYKCSMHICFYAYVCHVCIFILIYICTCTHMNVCVVVHVYVYMCVYQCMNVHVLCIYVYIYKSIDIKNPHAKPGGGGTYL